MFDALFILYIAGFKGREKLIGKFVPDRKYISIRTFLKPISKSFTPDFGTDSMVSFNEFEKFCFI